MTANLKETGSQLMDVQESRLANGVRVITSTIPRVQSVALGIWIGAGSRYEDQQRAGISHFVEHLLFKGTRRRSAKDISAAIEGRGGYLNAFTQEESTCYHARVAYEHLDVALDVLTDMYLNPLFEPREIDKERSVIIEEIMMYRDQPQHVVHELMTDALWLQHPLGRPVIGTPETLRTFTRDTLLQYKESMYVTSNTVFALAGRISHEDCVQRVAAFVARLKQKPVPRCARVGTGVKQRRITLRTKEIEQTHLAMGIRIFGRHDPRRYALRVMNALLGENASSRLFQVVREKHGLAYSISSGFHLFNDTGALVISAGLDRKRSLKAIGLLVRELARLKEHPVGLRELGRAKEYAVGQLRLGLESTTNHMLWIGDNLISYGRFIPPDEIIARITAVRAEEIQSLASDILRGEAVSLAVISPDLSSAHEPAIGDLLNEL